MNNEINDNIPARTSPGLTRSSFATTQNRVANDICVPRKILQDTPDLSYIQPEGNYYFKTSDSYQILSVYILLSFDFPFVRLLGVR
jgi:hypothetical protein